MASGFEVCLGLRFVAQGSGVYPRSCDTMPTVVKCSEKLEDEGCLSEG